MHESKEQIERWMQKIDSFLKENLKLELHKQKSKIISLSKGIDFVGYRNFYHFKLLRKRSIRKMKRRIKEFHNEELSLENINQIYQGWQAHAKWANTYGLRENLLKNN